MSNEVISIMIGIYLTYYNWLYATPLSYYLTPPMRGINES
jgi:hypothetical protein